MKTKFAAILLALFALESLSSCNFFWRYSEKPSKTYITRDYRIGDFSAINFEAVGNIEFTQSKGKTALSIYGPDNYVNMLKVSVENNTLYITMNKKYHFNNIKKMKIKISAPILTNIVSKGVGNINIPQILNINNLEVINKGVGNIKIDSLNGNSLCVSSDGVGNINLKGKIHVASLSCNGVGNIEADNLAAKIVEANCRGVGNITCNVTDSITAAVKGVGSIKYKGNPQEKDFNKSGIGSIKEY